MTGLVNDLPAPPDKLSTRLMDLAMVFGPDTDNAALLIEASKVIEIVEETYDRLHLPACRNCQGAPANPELPCNSCGHASSEEP